MAYGQPGVAPWQARQNNFLGSAGRQAIVQGMGGRQGILNTFMGANPQQQYNMLTGNYGPGSQAVRYNLNQALANQYGGNTAGGIINSFINTQGGLGGDPGTGSSRFQDFVSTAGGAPYNPLQFGGGGQPNAQRGQPISDNFGQGGSGSGSVGTPIPGIGNYAPNSMVDSSGNVVGQGGGYNGPPQLGSASGSPQTLGGLASGFGANTSIPNANAPNYALNVGQYLNPGAQYAMDWANKGLQGAYAGQGDLMSGNAMRGITDYNQQMALNNYWNPAVQTAQQQQGFGYGVNAADRAFAQQQQLMNQTIPFQQQLQLAQLGMQGAQGTQATQNLLATLLGQNALAAGQAQGTGTIGGANTISQMISQMLGNYLGQNALQNVFGNQPKATPQG